MHPVRRWIQRRVPGQREDPLGITGVSFISKFSAFSSSQKTPYYSFNFFVKQTEANFLKKIYGDFHIDFSSILSKFEAFKRPEVTQYGFQINAKIILRFLAEKQIMKELLYIFYNFFSIVLFF